MLGALLFSPFNYLDIGKPQRRSRGKRLDVPERNQHVAEVPKTHQINRDGTSQRLQIYLDLLTSTLMPAQQDPSGELTYSG